MDWNNELTASVRWLGLAFPLSLVGIAVLVTALGRWTAWGREFMRVTRDYFRGRDGWLPLLWGCVLIFTTLFAVRLNILFSFWYNDFYSAMQKLNAPAFWQALAAFSVLAAIHVTRVLLHYYLAQAFQIRWRSWLTRTLVDRWLAHESYYRSRFLSDGADNPDQRIQQDVEYFVGRTLSLLLGLLDAVVSLFSFTLILWTLSGPLNLGGFEVPRAMVYAVYLYVIVATLLALKIGRPLIRLNFLNEQLGANFRYALVRVREYAENIAFHRGEDVERAHLLGRFAEVIDNLWGIVSRSLKFQGVNLVFSQAAVVFPFIVQAPRLLSGQITLGDVIQTAQSFGKVEEALSFVRSSYDDFAGYRAVLSRLSGFVDAAEAAARQTRLAAAQGPGLRVDSLHVRTPGGQALVAGLSLHLAARESLLIRGPSGVGKTTLLRALAGLWPYVDGALERPVQAETMFLPQKPYLPLGSLRTALYYPAAAHAGDEAALVLERCRLGHLTALLDESGDWSNRLSLGEQQRLAIGRVLLNRPHLLFLDEASSAMDEALERCMYQLLREAVPGMTLVSVGHRSALAEFHMHRLDLLGDGVWQYAAAPP